MPVEPFRFPQTLYVHEPLTVSKNPVFDAYTTWEDGEEGDVLAVYALQMVVRHKINKSHALEPYPEAHPQYKEPNAK